MWNWDVQFWEAETQNQASVSDSFQVADHSDCFQLWNGQW